MSSRVNAVAVTTVRTQFEELIPLWDKRVEEEGYGSRSEYFFSAGLFDLTCRRKHKMTPWLLKQPLDVQEKHVRTIINDFDKPKEIAGWIDHRIEAAAKEEHLATLERNRELEERVRVLERELADLKERMLSGPDEG
jgi:hypothetical protein